MIVDRLRILTAALALTAIAAGVWHIERAFDGLKIERGLIETTPLQPLSPCST